MLLLDEPLEGLAPIIVEELTAAVRRMTEDEGIALVLVEQHAEVALRLTQDAVVIERGIIAHRARSANSSRPRHPRPLSRPEAGRTEAGEHRVSPSGVTRWRQRATGAPPAVRLPRPAGR